MMSALLLVGGSELQRTNYCFFFGRLLKTREMRPAGIKADFSVAGMTVFSPLVHDSQPAVCRPEEAAWGLVILWKTANP